MIPNDKWYSEIENNIDRILDFFINAILAVIMAGGIAFFIYWGLLNA